MSDSWYDYDEYLQPAHLKGKRVTLTIVRADEVETTQYGKKQIKPVLYFKGTRKYMFLNKTARKALSEMFGDQKAACVGKAISIQAKRLENGKETIVVLPPEIIKPSAPLPENVAREEKSDLDRIMDVLEFNDVEDPGTVLKNAITAAKGDAAAALAAVEAKFGKVPVV
jgi:hypothetical protein